jgi:hypothetical protein
MYRAWANIRHMQVAEVAGAGGRGLPLLLVSGFGAHRVLAEETGLHVLELSVRWRRGRSRMRSCAATAASPRRWCAA